MYIWYKRIFIGLYFLLDYIDWTLTIRCICTELSFWYMPSKLIVWKGQNPCVCCIQTADNFLMQYAMEFISLRFPFFHNMRRCIGKIDVVLFARCIYHPNRLYIVHSINTFYLRYNIQYAMEFISLRFPFFIIFRNFPQSKHRILVFFGTTLLKNLYPVKVWCIPRLLYV